MSKDDVNSKNLETIKRITIKLKEIFRGSPDFIGNIQLNIYKGNLASINKSERIK